MNLRTKSIAEGELFSVISSPMPNWYCCHILSIRVLQQRDLCAFIIVIYSFRHVLCYQLAYFVASRHLDSADRTVKVLPLLLSSRCWF